WCGDLRHLVTVWQYSNTTGMSFPAMFREQTVTDSGRQAPAGRQFFPEASSLSVKNGREKRKTKKHTQKAEKKKREEKKSVPEGRRRKYCPISRKQIYCW